MLSRVWPWQSKRRHRSDHLTAREKVEISRLLSEHYTHTEIAHLVNRSPATVGRWAKTLEPRAQQADRRQRERDPVGAALRDGAARITAAPEDATPAAPADARPGRLRLCPSADVLADAERQPDGSVVLAWAGDVALHVTAQAALKMGWPGLEQLARELGARL